MKRRTNRKDQPLATIRGTYGCGGCGTYTNLKIGDMRQCQACRSAKPLLLVTAGPESVWPTPLESLPRGSGPVNE